MKKDKIEIRKKFINHITLNGEKKTSENVILKSSKELQKNSKKQSNHTIKLAIINTTPIFKTHNILNKKRKKSKKTKVIPSFIKNQDSRTSLSMKLILKGLKNSNKSMSFFLKLKEEILSTATLKSSSVIIKNELQKQTQLNKRLLRYYKW